MTDFSITHVAFKQANFQILVDLCPDAIIGINRQGLVTIFNEAAEIITGWPAAEVVGKLHVTQLYHPPQLARQVKKAIYSTSDESVGRVRNMEVTIKTRTGSEIPVLLSAVVLEEDGVEVGSVGYFHDLTRTKKLERISITDTLTGLYNRYHFHTVLDRELGRSERYHRALTLVYLDLDKFKPFNDTFGHPEGDNVLRLVGRCCRQILRTQDPGFRIGGDEFALLLVETDLEGGYLVAERFRHSFNKQWLQNISDKNQKLPPISLSMGVAQHNQEQLPNGENENADNLIRRADMAMYEAKRAGGNRVVTAGAYIGKSLPNPDPVHLPHQQRFPEV